MKISLKYTIARCSVISLTLVPLAALILYLYQHREERLQDVFSGMRLLLFASAAVVSFASLRWRRILLDSIDRRFFREQYYSTNSKKQTRIQAPPGLRLRALAEFLFSRRVFEQVLEPTLRDLFDEYCEALDAERPRKAAWVRIRGYWSFWSAVLTQMPIPALKLIFKVLKAIR